MKNKNLRQLLMLSAMMLMSIVSMQVNAQNTEEEALKDAEKKVKLADKNPTNGKMQYEAGMALFSNELGEKKDLDRALTYANRALKIARENPAPKDTLLGLSCLEIGLIYLQKGRHENAFDYLEMAIDAFEVELGRDDPVTNGSKVVYGTFMLEADPYRGFAKILEGITDNDVAPKDKRVENMHEANIVLEWAFEQLMAKMTDVYRYALPAIYIDGKKFYIVQTSDWNIERPLIGWLTPSLLRTDEEEEAFQGDDTIICDEDGNMRIMTKEDKDKHKFEFSFRHLISKPRKLESNEGDSRIWFLEPESHAKLLKMFRDFKAGNK